MILYYHSIPGEYRERFTNQLDKLLHLTRPIPINTVPPLIPGIRYSAITFDDAFKNIVDNALPELIRKNIPATIFVTTGVLGEHATWWPGDARERHERIATAEDIRQLPKELISVGSHTLSHPKLPSLSQAEAKRELCESRRKLESLLGYPITTFSFPWGAFNRNLVECCREAGYTRVFTTLPFTAFRDPEEFVSGRVAADPTDWPLEFHLKLVGAYRWLPLAFSVKRFILARVLLSKRRSASEPSAKRAVV